MYASEIENLIRRQTNQVDHHSTTWVSVTKQEWHSIHKDIHLNLIEISGTWMKWILSICYAFRIKVVSCELSKVCKHFLCFISGSQTLCYWDLQKIIHIPILNLVVTCDPHFEIPRVLINLLGIACTYWQSSLGFQTKFFPSSTWSFRVWTFRALQPPSKQYTILPKGCDPHFENSILDGIRQQDSR